MIKTLVIDSDSVFLDLVQILLKREDCEVITCSNGLDAYNVVKREIPDVIVLDPLLPFIDGGTVIALLKGDPETFSIPILLCTSSALPADERTKLEKEVNGTLSKPGDIPKLATKLRAVVAGQQRQRPAA